MNWSDLAKAGVTYSSEWITANIEPIIACLGIIALCIQIYYNQQHNKLSVRPHLCFNNHTKTAAQNTTYSLKIANKGTGPAIIKTFNLYYKAKKLSGNSEQVQEQIKKLIQNSDIGIKVNHINHLNQNYAIASNEEMLLAQIIFPTDKLSTFRANIEEIDIHIEYESIYKISDEISSLEDTKLYPRSINS